MGNFSSLGKFPVSTFLLNSAFKVSEQLFQLIFKICSGIFLNIEDFFVLKLRNSFSILDKETSLNKSGDNFQILIWFLYLKVALSTGSKTSFELFVRYEFSIMLTVLVAFWKKLLNSSDTNLSSDIIFSLSALSVILLIMLRFSEKMCWMFFQNVLFSVMLILLVYGRMFCVIFCIIYYCWSFTCCLSWVLGSSSKCSQLKSFL